VTARDLARRLPHDDWVVRRRGHDGNRRARTGRVVQYEVLAVEGPPHERRFVCAALIDGERLGEGRGSTKKAAEQEAAAQALATLQVPQAEA